MGLDNPIEGMTALAENIKESVQHLRTVIDGIDDLINLHGAVYDTSTTTGDETRGHLASVKDELERQAAIMEETADRIENHRNMIAGS